MCVEVHDVPVDLLVDDRRGALQSHCVVLQPHTGSLPLLPFPGAGLVLVEDQRWTVDVEGKLLTVDGDEKSPGNVVGDLVRNLLTESVYMVVPQVVMCMIEP